LIELDILPFLLFVISFDLMLLVRDDKLVGHKLADHKLMMMGDGEITSSIKDDYDLLFFLTSILVDNFYARVLVS